MTEQQPVFDPERFREEGRAVVDWIADYWASLPSRPVSPAVSPGDVRSHLPSQPPEAAEPLAALHRFQQHSLFQQQKGHPINYNY
jgi:aromatic-L-amino-acid decarboxylase